MSSGIVGSLASIFFSYIIDDVRNIVVFAGNECSKEKETYYYNVAYDTGKLLAKFGYITVTGGGPGLMNEVMRGAYDAGGKTESVCLVVNGREFSKFSHKKIIYHSLVRRQTKLISLADGFVALPGGIGTYYEIMAVLAMKRKMEISRQSPLVLLSDYFNEFEPLIDKMIDEGFIGREISAFFKFAASPGETVNMLEAAFAGEEQPE